MKAADFCYWLQGHFEITNSNELTEQQVKIIRNHLNLVFKHELDPLEEKDNGKSKEELNNIHDNIHSGIDPHAILMREWRNNFGG